MALTLDGTSGISCSGNIISSAGVISATGNIYGGNVIGTIAPAALNISGNLSAYGVVVSLSPSSTGGTISAAGNITGGNIITAGNVTCGNITNYNSSGVGNVGSSLVYFNTVFAKATSAQYSDLAEHYLADANYAPGTVIVHGGSREVTTSDIDHDPRVAGVISTDPSYIMNAGLTGDYSVVVGLVGRVPCQVQGPVKRGDRLVNVAPGIAGLFDPAKAQPGCLVGKSLEDHHESTVKLIEVAVGRS
jgi:hypothetical protein